MRVRFQEAILISQEGSVVLSTTPNSEMDFELVLSALRAQIVDGDASSTYETKPMAPKLKRRVKRGRPSNAG
jgi:hypothetical protein